jgi:hypothetical protein
MGNTYSSAKPSLPALNLSKVCRETLKPRGQQVYRICSRNTLVLLDLTALACRSLSAVVTLATNLLYCPLLPALLYLSAHAG